jgi:diphthamide synthase (EF-2-diphthine--ammonia ligase)
MSNRPRLLLSWSSGKDSAWTLHRLRMQDAFEIAGLVTTVNEAFDRVAMHGVRAELLEAQAAAAGVPLWRVDLPWPCPNAEYETRMRALIERARAAGVTHMAFGDLFLEDVRAYRERQLAGTGITPLFPLWGLNTAQLARDMCAGGLGAIRRARIRSAAARRAAARHRPVRRARRVPQLLPCRADVPQSDSRDRR